MPADLSEKIKKAAVINDLSGLGRCSLSVALPLISALGVQACPLPTAILSNQTGYKSTYYLDFTEHLIPYAAEWKKLGVHFDSILSGFLGSVEEVEVVSQILGDFRSKDTRLVVDPVLGGGGLRYPAFPPEMVQAYEQLLAQADIITPNVTEACLLSDFPYHDADDGRGWSAEELTEIARRLQAKGAKAVVITGIPDSEGMANFCFEPGEHTTLVKSPRYGVKRSGTGDMLAAIVTAGAAKGTGLVASVRRAADFISRVIQPTEAAGIDPREGLLFEPFLSELSVL